MNDAPNPDSSLVFLARRAEELPKYIVDYPAGLLAAMISDVVVTSILILAVAVGFLTCNVWWAVVAFFGAYTFVRGIGTVAYAIGSSGMMISQRMGSSSLTPVVPPGATMGQVPVVLPSSNK